MPRGIYKRETPNKGIFRKGGHLPSLETRLKTSESIKEKYINGYISPLKGKKRSEETRKKMSDSRRGKIPWNKGMGGFLGGEKHYNWKGGITPLVLQIRHSFQSRQWRSDVFTRDNFTCQMCGVKGVGLHADHIKSFSKIFLENKITSLEQAFVCEEFWNINNGRTLCAKCHRLTDNYGNKSKINF